MHEERRVHVIDSHTEGEPTRVVVKGTPKLMSATLPGRVDELRREHDGLRSGIICEPRGNDAIVGAYLFEPTTAEADLEVVFFNNARYLGMCGHGTIGVVSTLAFLKRLDPGEIRLETPVGLVRAMLHEDGRVTVWNVPSYRFRKSVSLGVPGFGKVVGDIAYGGNWFFLLEAEDLELRLSNLEALNAFTTSIRRALGDQGITGEHGEEVDHIELFGPPEREDADSKNFVLCPGLAYDRSPCGTGLSAKLACLAADGKLKPGEVWRQESIIGSLFEGSFELSGKGILPSITGRAWITGESVLIFPKDDPFREGIVA
jgi:4-hydroxyproline epimerase